eukprot:758077-Hanusia_phi.AAC.2
MKSSSDKAPTKITTIHPPALRPLAPLLPCSPLPSPRFLLATSCSSSSWPSHRGVPLARQSVPAHKRKSARLPKACSVFDICILRQDMTCEERRER